MNEQQILANLMKDPEYRKALQALILEDKDLANEVCPARESIVAFVWCAEMVDQNSGVVYYHPIIVPHQNMMSMELDAMMNPENYTMMASFDQFEAYQHEFMVKMFTSVYGDQYPIRLISIPEDTYAKLLAALTSLVTSILDEINQCFVHMDNIARMANTSSDMMKMRLIASVFGQMTTVASCFNRNMDVVNSEGHNYHVEREENDEDSCEDDWDDEDEDVCDDEIDI